MGERVKGGGKQIFVEAQSLVHGVRGEDYGHPRENFTQTGRIWGGILSNWHPGIPDIPPDLVALMMVGSKISRETNHHKRDNCVDGAGYFETCRMVHEDPTDGTPACPDCGEVMSLILDIPERAVYWCRACTTHTEIKRGGG